MSESKLQGARRVVRLAVSVILVAAGSHASATTAAAQDAPPPARLSLKQAVNQAVRNSRDLALARIQQTITEKAAGLNRADFLPNLYGGSGAAYTNGMPQTPGGQAPAIFSVSYIQTLFNPPLRGQLKAAEERAVGQQSNVEAVRDQVMLRAASAYLELAKTRHALELMRRQRDGAQRILDLTRDRAGAGLELPIEVTRAQLQSARIEQRILQLEGTEDSLDGELHNMLGLQADQRIEVVAEDLPGTLDQPTPALVQLALSSNSTVKQAEAEQRARQFRLDGERGGRYPTIDLVGQYSILSRINNYDQFFKKFQRHNINVGVQINIPILSARTNSAVSFAQTDLNAAELDLRNKRGLLELEVRRESRRTREMDAGREVARLELQLAQQNLAVLQAQFQEGRLNLRDLERARIEENEKWMAFLDAEFERQRAQLELMRTTGQLAKIFQ
jgi:outer membrane protein TolC